MKFIRKTTIEEEVSNGNTGMAKVSVQCLMEHSDWLKILFSVDSLLQENPLLRKTANPQ